MSKTSSSNNKVLQKADMHREKIWKKRVKDLEKQLMVEAAKRRQLEQSCLQCGSRDLSWLEGLSEPICGGCALEDKIQELEQQL